MSSVVVTFNGRITLPINIRKQLGLKTGDKIDFVDIGDGRFALCPRAAETEVEADEDGEVSELVVGRSAIN
jgi:AbrB family looped-hinge helix DNA binding protein